MFTEQLMCVDCGTELGTVRLESDEFDRAVMLGDDGEIFFSSWEVGASAEAVCPDCTAE